MAKFAAVASVCVSASVAASTPPDVEQKFSEFEAAFGKNYAVSERQHRMAIFAANLESFESLQQTERGTAIYSHLTPFADLSPDEFATRLGVVGSGSSAEIVELPSHDLADAFDWRENGFTTHVKDQGSCGSCWAFSVVANLEGAGFKETGKLVRLSEQQLVDCSTSSSGGPNNGCNGGQMGKTMEWMVDNDVGLEYQEDYVYAGVPGPCRHNKANEVLKISKWMKISADDSQMMAALVQYGPLSVGVAASTWHGYKGGILDQADCQNENHGVALVGYGDESSIPYFTIRNSWGVGWGEEGHIRLVRGKDMCLVNDDVTTATVITLDDSRPEPDEPTPGPDCCETKGIASFDDCAAYCQAQGTFMKSCDIPGPHCKCFNGDGCEPFPACGSGATPPFMRLV